MMTNNVKEITESNNDIEWTEIERLSDKYGITIVSAEENKRLNGEHRNNMASSGSMIFLNEFDDPDFEIVAFFHELGHVEISRSPYFSFNSAFCYLASEALAWSVGFAIAEREGYVWDYRSKQKEYARECLKTYLNHEGELGGFK